MIRRRADVSGLTIAVLAAGLLWLAAPPALAQDSPSTLAASAEDAAWRQDLAAWRAQRERQITAPDGWLTLAGLEWLKPGVNSVGSAAGNQIRLNAPAPERMGLLTVNGATVQLLAPAGGFPAGLTVDGKPPREGALTVDNAQPPAIAWRGLTLAVLKRAGRFMLQIKDADSPARKDFHGLNWYAPDPRFVVTARWIPFKPPQVEEIPTVLGTTLKLRAPGLAMFLLDGKVLHLEPVVEDPEGKTLLFILRDETSATTTYGGGRFLHVGLPDQGLDKPGSLTLDFNRLENPPCAYTNYATCPLPPQQNQLGVALEAGERRFEH
jgi:uncharacterized protein (DUF1684 family)